MRLIDADAIFPNGCVTVYECDGAMTADGILKAIKDAPTVDAESVRQQNVIVLPCNIGDAVYEVAFFKDGTRSHIKKYTCSGIHISYVVTRWRYEKPVHYLVVKTDAGHSMRIPMNALGKTLFLSRAEAKSVLTKPKMDGET